MNQPVEFSALIEAEAVTTLGRNGVHPDKIRALAQELIRIMHRILGSGKKITEGKTTIDREMLCDPEALEVIIDRIREAVTNGHGNGYDEEACVLPSGCERATITRFTHEGIIARPAKGGKTMYIPAEKTGCFRPGQDIVVRPTLDVDEFGHRVATLEGSQTT